MDPIKTGSFIKELRKNKGWTQEQMAEAFRVSRRTVSRWETGSNLPELDLLMEMADFFNVDLRELLDGERRAKKMEKELEETVLKVADYSSEEKRKWTRRMHFLFLAGFLAAVLHTVLIFTGHEDGALGSCCLGFACGILLVGVMMTGRYSAQIRAFKQRLLQRKNAGKPPIG
ncbi:helix-turn-helix domain-containing protein [uncultured Ruthenibacterium sp.]|uniref:helix-turn-helix domain-containing protein n=1 Tax=uncultured Ruthenibacterium sp. TaxID=1905347 RepID=UPI00349EFD64